MQRKPQHLGSSLLIAIALSSLGLGGCYPFGLFSQSHKIGSSEVKQYVGSMNRAQQAYVLENNHFSQSVPALGLGMLEKTERYQYSTRANATAAFNYGIVYNDRYTRYIGPIPYPTKGNYYSYVGGVFLVPSKEDSPNAPTGNMTTKAILCTATTPGKQHPAEPILVNGQPKCSPGTEVVP